MKSKQPKKKMEIEDLAGHVSKEIENLAVMVQKGFKEQLDNLNEFKTDMYGFKDEMYEFRDKMFEFKSSTDLNISEIKGHLVGIEDNLAEINPLMNLLKYNDRDLEKRVTKIENKLGMA